MLIIKNSPPQLKEIRNLRQGNIAAILTHQIHLGIGFCLGMLFISNLAIAQQSDDGIWEVIHDLPSARAASEPWIRPQKATIFYLNKPTLQRRLSSAPMEFSIQNVDDLPVITIPMPDGTYARFRFEESPVMHPDLAARYPDIKTYLGQGIDDPGATIRFDQTPSGFHAQILSANGAVYVDPYSRGDTNTYSSYYRRDFQDAAKEMQCFVESPSQPSQRSPARRGPRRSGTSLRTYRIAIGATAEYTAWHGGKPQAIAAIATTLNRVTGIYEVELAVRLVLVANNDNLVFTDSATDGYTNNNSGNLLVESST